MTLEYFLMQFGIQNTNFRTHQMIRYFIYFFFNNKVKVL
ncbi:hypothetical protein Godav_017984 [Gossypium davidsonii]|uniref:Uncharacterized protein n=1 Tax=Gossypium davidsonii TaxID=34287 RepID=A0A7J8QW94_GOSDV|nr:hypothetical protein [Gossypium davidsonii]